MFNCGEEHWLKDPLEAALAASGRDLAVDIGANTGTWTVELAKEFKRVIAVEADVRAAAMIPRLPNVDVIEKAAYSNSDGVTFHFREESVYGSILDKHPIGGGGGKDVPCVTEKSVPTVTLDDLGGFVVPDFVKIDVEGGEVEVLKGAVDDWFSTVFLVECHDTYDAVKAELERLGLCVSRIAHPFPGHPGHCWALGVPWE
jgi:FkbM family methyltransferase